MIASHVLREGTDYGFTEMPFEVKMEMVKKRLERGEVKIFFDVKASRCEIMAVENTVAP